MTVGELIALLQALDPEMPVFRSNGDLPDYLACDPEDVGVRTILPYEWNAEIFEESAEGAKALCIG